MIDAIILGAILFVPLMFWAIPQAKRDLQEAKRQRKKS